MSFSSLIFLVILSSGTGRYHGDRNKQKLYLNNKDLINDWPQSDLSLMQKKQAYKHTMDRLLQATQTLDDKKILQLATRVQQALEMKRKAYLRDVMKELRRKWNARPMVEFGPGSYKPEVSNYNPEVLGEDLKRLLALKKKQEDEEKDLNAE